MALQKTSSKTARDISGIGRSKVTQTSSGGGGGGSKEKTVPVNPSTYEFDPNSTFRVPESQVKTRPQTVTVDISNYGSGAGLQSSTTKTSEKVSPIVQALIRGEVSPKDVTSGRAKAFERTVTPSEAQILAQQSLRQDVEGYKFSGVRLEANQSVDLKADRRKQNILFQSNNGVLKGEQNPLKQQSILYQSGELKQSRSQEFLFGKKEAVGFSSRTGTTINVVGTSRGVVGIGKDLGIGLKSSVVDPLISFGKGTKKILEFEAENPARGGIGAWNPKENNLKQRDIKFKQLVSSDSDVKTALVGGGLLLSYPISSAPVVIAGTVQSVKGAYSIGKGLVSKDFIKVGEGVGDVVTGELTVKSFKRPFAELTKTKVKAEDVFGGEISGRKVTSKSTKEALSQFEAGRLKTGSVEVVSASPSSLTGGKLVDIGAGPKGAAGLEDSGLFVGPKTRANLMFTGLGKEGGESSLTINPITEVKRFFGKSPVVSTIVVGDVVVPGASVLGQPGFLNVNKQFVGEGVAVITKRSMIGKGEVKPQMFSPVQDFRSEGGLVRLKGKLYKEGGTSETEAVIPTGSVLKKVSNKEFTVINQKKFFGYDVPFTGDLIELPKYELVSGKKTIGKSIKKEKLFDAKDVGLKDSASQSSFSGGRKRSLLSGVDSYGESIVGSGKSFLSTKNSLVNGSSFSSGDFSSDISRLSIKPSTSSVGNVVGSTSSSFVGSSIRPFSKSSSLVSRGQSTSSISKVVGGSFQGVSFKDGFKTPTFENIPKLRRTDERFSVEVRSLGKFKKVGEGVNLKDAIQLGKSVTGGSAARSFKIKTLAGKSLQGLDIGKDYYKKGDVYIEKSGVAINTGGELKQITSQGIASQRRKRKGVF